MKFSEFLNESAEFTPEEALKLINQFNASSPEKRAGAPLTLNRMNLTKIPVPIRDMPKEALLLSDNSKLNTFENMPKVALFIRLNNNNFKSLHNIHVYIHETTGMSGISFNGNSIQSSILGLLKIKNLKSVEFTEDNTSALSKAETIINKYLPNTRGNDAVMECQQELIDAGLDEYAQL